jgi:hypothetical protein
MGKQFAGPYTLWHAVLRDRQCEQEHDLLPHGEAAFFPMKLFFSLALIAAMTAAPIVAQAPPSKDDQELLTLIKEVQTQQAQIAENQTKIEAKMAELAETIRVARLFAGKAGK